MGVASECISQNTSNLNSFSWLDTINMLILTYIICTFLQPALNSKTFQYPDISNAKIQHKANSASKLAENNNINNKK